MTTGNNSKKEVPEASVPGADNAEAKANAGAETDEVVICDECGDTLWDAVLAQDDKANALKHVCKIPMKQ